MEGWKTYKGIILSGIVVILFFAVAAVAVNTAQTKEKFTYAEHLFQEDTVNEINIEIDEADWQDMLENPLEEEYHRTDVTINGETVGNVAIRTKGNTSLTSVANSDSDRYSFKLDFDYYDNNGNYYGMKKLCLNNNYADNSSMREYICYKIMKSMGLTVPDCAYSHITVNGEEWGLYLAVEPVDEVFLQTRFADATGDLYKPEGMGGTGADLAYRGDDISEYTGLNLKTNLETSDGSEILALMQALESGEGLETVLDVESTLKYIAANVALANFDSYLGGTTHNYYLYEENGFFTVIPWDLNLAFGGFGGGEVDIYEPASNSMGGGPGGDRGEKKETEPTAESMESPAQPDAEQPQQGENRMEQPKQQKDAQGFAEKEMPNQMAQPNGEAMPEQAEQQQDRQQFDGKEMPEMPSMGSGEKPLVTTLLNEEAFLAQYEAYLKEIAETYLTEEYMAAMVTKVHDLIAPYIEKDATAFYTYEEFEQACSVDPTDEYSLVYYAVNMAESIQNQLAGGEPTFNTSSLKGGGMGGEKGGKGGGMPDFDGEMPDFGGEMPDFGGEMPDFSGEMPAFDGEQPDFSGEMPTQQNLPTDGDQPQMQQDADTKRTHKEHSFDQNGGNPPQMPGGMGGERGIQQIDWKETLPMMAVCGGAFLLGVVVLICFKRKKDLKPPKDN